MRCPTRDLTAYRMYKKRKVLLVFLSRTAKKYIFPNIFRQISYDIALNSLEHQMFYLHTPDIAKRQDLIAFERGWLLTLGDTASTKK